jgi:hypothetical protein
MNDLPDSCNGNIAVSSGPHRCIGELDDGPDDTGEGERLGSIMPNQFQAYIDRWVRYWPKKPFIVKQGYDRPWYHRKYKDKQEFLPLYPDLAIEWVERHLDGHQWMEWKSRQEPGCVHREEDFWLGLMMPRKTTVSNIDIDTKEYQVGHYRSRQYHKVKQTSRVRPVMALPLSHLKTIKSIYDHFPNRIWCVSSLTLGLHAWIVYKHPKPTLMIHEATKQELASIGLGQIEVHPMPGRGQRRPFGQGYVTITPERPLTSWWRQHDYFENDRRSPPFCQIVRVLLDLMTEQWRLWRLNSPAEALKLNSVEHHLADAEQWLAAGCPGNTEHLAPGQNLSPNVALVKEEPEGGRSSLQATLHKPSRQFDLDTLRHGNWPKELARLAQEGLDAPKSLHFVCYEMAKYLYWYELYDLPEEERLAEIVQLLKVFATTKHNGMSERINQGKSVEEDILQTVVSAAKLDEEYRKESLELFCRMRQKRDTGQYRRLICLRPLVLGDGQASVPSSSLFSLPTLCGGSLEEELPKELTVQIELHAGRSKVIKFATQFVNLLWNNKGSARVSGERMCELLGYKDRSQARKYVNILIKAKVLRKGEGYKVCHAAKRYTLTEETMDLLLSARFENKQVI